MIGLALAWLPFLPVRLLPITDLPQHLAQVRLAFEVWGLAPATVDLGDLVVRPLAPNAFVYAPLFVLTWLLGPLAGGAVAVAALVGLSVVALHRLAVRLAAPPEHALLAGVFCFNAALYWGLLNFLSGLPVLLWALPEALAPRPVRSAAREAVVTLAVALALAWTHVLWLPVYALALGLGALRQRSRLGLRFGALVPVAIIVGAFRASLSEARSAAGFHVEAVYSSTFLERLTPGWWLDGALGGVRGVLEPAVALAVLVWITLAWVAHLRRGELVPAPSRAALALGLALLVACAALPDLYLNTLLFNRRYLGLAAMLLVLSAPSLPGSARLRSMGALLIAVVFSLGTTLAWVVHEQLDLAGLSEALSSTDVPKSVLGLTFAHRGMAIRGEPFLQAAAYFQALHGGELGFSFAEHYTSAVAYRHPRRRRWTPGLEWRPQRVTRADVDAFDCVLVREDAAGHARFAALSGRRGLPAGEPFRLYCR